MRGRVEQKEWGREDEETRAKREKSMQKSVEKRKGEMITGRKRVKEKGRYRTVCKRKSGKEGKEKGSD